MRRHVFSTGLSSRWLPARELFTGKQGMPGVKGSAQDLGLTWKLVALLCLALMAKDLRACTTAVVSGKATPDGRPLLWKNRDTSARANEVITLSGKRFQAVAVANAGSRGNIWMGVNEAGFCIENSVSSDMRGDGPAHGLGNGSFMKNALETCATVADFEKLLQETDRTGRSTTANYGVIDAEGGAMLFETGPTSHVKFDANDPRVAPHGYIVRSNFATTARGLPANPTPAQLTEIYSADRFCRACSLMESCRDEQQQISLKYLLRNCARDVADAAGHAVPGTVNAPTGTLPPLLLTDNTISRTTTVSAAVFHGVKPGENPALTTMWVILGDPKFSIAVPCWASAEVDDMLTEEIGAELGEIATTLREWHYSSAKKGVDTDGLTGIWSDLWRVEDELIVETRHQLDRWQQRGMTSQALTSYHKSAAGTVTRAMQQELNEAKEHALRRTAPPAPNFATGPQKTVAP